MLAADYAAVSLIMFTYFWLLISSTVCGHENHLLIFCGVSLSYCSAADSFRHLLMLVIRCGIYVIISDFVPLCVCVYVHLSRIWH